MSTLELGRELGFAEARMHYFHQELGGTAQSCIHLQVEGPLHAERLERYFEELVARQQILRTSIVEQDGIPSFAIASVDAPRYVRRLREREDQWHATIDEMNRSSLPEGAPVQLIHLDGGSGPGAIHDLILRSHHAVIDGRCMSWILSEVLQRAVGVKETPFREVPIPPNAESRIRSALSWQDFLVSAQKARSLNESADYPEHPQIVRLEDRTSSFRSWQVPVDLVRSLAAHASTAKVSLNALLSACTWAAVALESPTRRKFALTTAFSTRELCTPKLADDELACCLSVITTAHAQPKSNPLDLTQLAVEYQAEFTKNFLQQVFPPKNFEPDALKAGIGSLLQKHAFMSDFGFTLGDIPAEFEIGHLRLRSMHAVSNRRAGNTTVVVHGARWGDTLCFTFNYPRPLVSEEWMDRLVARFRELLQGAVASDVCTK